MKVLNLIFGIPFIPVWETNDIDAYVPEIWARESLMILRENMVMANLVHRDFEDEIQAHGDVVNTRRPANFEGKRKATTDNVTIQDATATNVAVPLDQHVHTSFLLRDSEESKSFKDLVTEFLEPAVIGMARFVDRIVLGQAARWLNVNATYAGGLTGGIAKADVIEARQNLNVNLAPMAPRNAVYTPAGESDLLEISDFTTADKIGDDGTTMREASIGRKMGLNHWMDQNAKDLLASELNTTTGAINNGAGYVAGTTVLTMDGHAATIANGTYVRIAGDDVPAPWRDASC